MTTTTHDGATVFYEDVGSGDPPLVLVHGLGSHEQFRAQIDHFSRNHRVLALDLPGYGRSSAGGDRTFTLDALAADVAWLCRRLDLPPAVIVGHSMSGAIAVQIAADHPELCAAIVLLDPTPLVGAGMFQQALAPFVAALAGPAYRQAIQGFSERMFRASDDAAARSRIVADMASAPAAVVASSMASAAGWDATAAAGRVRAPVLAITAGDGVPTALGTVQQLLPHAELGRTVGAGHFAHVLVPEQVNAMIERFLTECATELAHT